MPQREQRTAISHVSFYADDWLSGTLELSAEQRGAFITVCALYYAKQGRVPDNDHWLAGMCNMSTRKWRKIKSELVSFGKIEIIDGFIYQERAEIELENAMKAKSIAQEKGSSGGRKSAEIRANALKRNNSTSSPATTPAQPDNEAGVQPPFPSPISVSKDTDAGASKILSTKDRIWGPLLDWMTDHTGQSEKSLRGLIGKWCRDHGEEKVCETLAMLDHENPADPVSWVTSKLAGKSSKGWLPSSSIDEISERIESREGRDAAISWENAYQYKNKGAVAKYREYGGVGY